MPSIEFFKTVAGLIPTLFLAALVESYWFRPTAEDGPGASLSAVVALGSFVVGEAFCLQVIASDRVDTASVVVVTGSLGIGGFVLLVSPVVKILDGETAAIVAGNFSESYTIRILTTIPLLFVLFSPLLFAGWALLAWLT